MAMRSKIWIALVCAVFLATGFGEVRGAALDSSLDSLEADLARLRGVLAEAPRSATPASLLETYHGLLNEDDGANPPMENVAMGNAQPAGAGPIGEPTSDAYMGQPAGAGPNVLGSANPVSGGDPVLDGAIAAPQAAPIANEVMETSEGTVTETPIGRIIDPPGEMSNMVNNVGGIPEALPMDAVAQANAQANGGPVNSASAQPTSKDAPQEQAAKKEDPNKLKSNGPIATVIGGNAPPSEQRRTFAKKLEKSIGSVKQALNGNVDNIGNHLQNIVNDVSSIVNAKKDFQAAVNAKSHSMTGAFESAANKLRADSTPYLRGQPARTSKDVIDCTACRFAFLHIEVDVGNTYSEKALYDAFVHHCAEMQMSRLFFSACNDMFVQIDDMIGDYLNGHTVNQLCMNARMCR